jgi:hypothetical protein
MAASGTEVTIPLNVSDKFGVFYTSTDPVTGYTGNLSEFNFEADPSSVAGVSNLSDSRISWDFGDGNTSSGLSATHQYRFPGNYTVSCVLYDKDGDPHKSSTSRTLKIYNYLPDQVLWRTDSITNSQTETVTAGRLSNELTIERYNSWQDYSSLSATGYTLNLYASGSNSNYVSKDQYLNDKNIHFQKIWRFVDNNKNTTPTPSVSTIDTPLYYSVVSSASQAGGSLTKSLSTSNDSIFVGTSGYALVHYLDDCESDQVNLFASSNAGNFSTYDHSVFNIPRSQYIDLNIDYYSHKPAVLPVTIIPNIPNKLLITSNGIPGFDIGQNKYEKSPISYTVSVADVDNNIIKCLPILSAGNESEYFRVEHNFIKTPFEYTTYYSNTAVNFDQYGALSLFAVVTGSTLNESITASCIANLGTGTYGLTGESSSFNIWPLSGQYHIAKMSEDYDHAATLQSYILQDTISEKSNFTNWFIKEIFGSHLDDPEVMGKTIYEKIDNFTSNINDIDFCNVDALYSLAEMVNLNFNDYRYNFPAGIKRLVDLLSINQKRLFGFRDNSNTNFDKTGYTLSDSSLIGRNLGSILSTSTYTVTAGVPIISNQLFGNQLKFVNTMVVSGAPDQEGYSTTYGGLTSYALSSYDVTWGWGLSFPVGEDISNYYDFYSYIDSGVYELSAADVVNGVIDFSNSLTTLKETNSAVVDWTEKYGTVDAMFDHRLRKGLDLFDLEIASTVEVTAGTDGDEVAAPSPSATPSVTPSPTPSISVSITPSVTPSITVTPSVTPSVGSEYWENISSIWDNITKTYDTMSAGIGSSPTPSVTPSVSVSPSISVTPSVTPSITVTPSVTPSISVTPSVTPSISPSASLGVFWEAHNDLWIDVIKKWDEM